MKIYIIQYPDGRTKITDRGNWEQEVSACKNLEIEYVVKNNGIGQELVIMESRYHNETNTKISRMATIWS